MFTEPAQGPQSSRTGTMAYTWCGKKKMGVVPACTYPRKEGEEVVLLIVDDISRVPLVPLLGVPQPHRAGPGLPSTTASQPLTAPVGKTSPHCQGHAQHRSHTHSCPPFLECFSSTFTGLDPQPYLGIPPSSEMGNRAEAPQKLCSKSKTLCVHTQIIYFKTQNSFFNW